MDSPGVARRNERQKIRGAGLKDVTSPQETLRRRQGGGFLFPGRLFLQQRIDNKPKFAVSLQPYQGNSINKEFGSRTNP